MFFQVVFVLPAIPAPANLNTRTIFNVKSLNNKSADLTVENSGEDLFKVVPGKAINADNIFLDNGEIK